MKTLGILITDITNPLYRSMMSAGVSQAD